MDNAKLHIFISYSNQNRQFADQLRADLQNQGLQVWIDKQSIKFGDPNWEESIRNAIRDAYVVILIASPQVTASVYIQGELEIAKMYNCRRFAIWADGDDEEWVNCVPLDMIKTQRIDARGERYQKALYELIAEIKKYIPITSSSPSIEYLDIDFQPRNPFKGLHSFTSDDQLDFFGRDHLVSELLEKLQNYTHKSRFLAVIGPSGSGKSSVVMAGIMPKLQQGALEGSDQWLYLEPVLPGKSPLDSLAIVLSNKLGLGISPILYDLQNDVRGLHLTINRIIKKRDQRVVLFIDQFEELFTQTLNPIERNQFIRLIVNAATELDGSTLVIITLRADFYNRPMDYPELARLIEAQNKSVLPMTIEELHDVIEKPAQLKDVKIRFENRLIGDLLFEVRGESGALPLLQFTLDQLFRLRQGNVITNETYQHIGGVRGALAKHAESTYSNLPTHQHREVARGLFLRLVKLGDTEQDTTRRRATLNELITPDEEKTRLLEETRNWFIDARLLITDSTTLEIIHEALIREWKHLSDWLSVSRNDVRFQQIITRDADEWRKKGRRIEDLYRGLKLKEAQDWMDRNVISVAEKEFIDEAILNEKQEVAKAIKYEQISIRADELEKVVASRTHELEKERDRIETLYQITSEFGKSLDFKSIFPSVLQMTIHATGAQDGAILRLDLIDDSFYFLTTQPNEMSETDNPNHPLKQLASWFMEQDSFSIIIEDLYHLANWNPNIGGTEYWRSALMVQLVANDELLGLLVILSREINIFTNDHIRLITSIGNQIATSINNFDLYQLIRDQAERLGGLIRDEQDVSAINQTIFENINDGVIFIDSDKKITLFNKSLEKLLPVSKDATLTQLINTNNEAIISWIEQVEKFLDSQQFNQHVSQKINLNNQLVELSVIPINIGKFLGVLSVFHIINFSKDDESI